MLMRARHRDGKVLLRHDLRFDGNNWTQAHRDWLARVRLAEPVAQAVRADGLGAIDALVVRRDSLERQMTALVPDSPWATEAVRLRCLRGIDTLSALGFCAEAKCRFRCLKAAARSVGDVSAAGGVGEGLTNGPVAWVRV